MYDCDKKKHDKDSFVLKHQRRQRVASRECPAAGGAAVLSPSSHVSVASTLSKDNGPLAASLSPPATDSRNHSSATETAKIKS